MKDAARWPGICQISAQTYSAMNRSLLLVLALVFSTGLFAQDPVKDQVVAVSYTHLTLPTSDLV